jgi:molybdenum cofactor cytidylyltransferase
MSGRPPDRIIGILLAAGAGRRFGGDKLMHRLPDGSPVAVAAGRALIRALPGSLAVVRPGNIALERALAEIGLAVTVCAQADEGMGASLAHAVRASRHADGWVVALADMPFVQPETVAAVAERLAAGAALCAPSVAGVRGHPVGLSSRYRDALEALHGDVGAREVLRSRADRLELVPVDDPGAVRDIDTREDLR